MWSKQQFWGLGGVLLCSGQDQKERQPVNRSEELLEHKSLKEFMLALTERYKDTVQHSLLHMGPAKVPCTENVYNRHVNNRTGPWTNERRWYASCVMLWVMINWKTFGHAFMMCSTYLNKGHPFVKMISPNGSGIFQQDERPLPHSKHWTLSRTWPSSRCLNRIKHPWDVLDKLSASPSNLWDLKNMLLTSI